MRGLGIWSLVLGALAVGASACETTTLEFRSPEGSVLALGSDWFNPAQRVVFRSRVELEQAHSASDEEGTACEGEVRIDGEIDLTRLPPGAARYIAVDERGHKIFVHGFYWIYRYEKTTHDELAAHYVDIAPADIYRLLEGKPVTVTEERSDGTRIFKFELGVLLPAEASRGEVTGEEPTEES